MSSNSSSLVAFCIFLCGLICGTGSTITIKVEIWARSPCIDPQETFDLTIARVLCEGCLWHVLCRHRWAQRGVRETVDHHLGELPTTPASLTRTVEKNDPRVTPRSSFVFLRLCLTKLLRVGDVPRHGFCLAHPFPLPLLLWAIPRGGHGNRLGGRQNRKPTLRDTDKGHHHSPSGERRVSLVRTLRVPRANAACAT